MLESGFLLALLRAVAVPKRRARAKSPQPPRAPILPTTAPTLPLAPLHLPHPSPSLTIHLLPSWLEISESAVADVLTSRSGWHCVGITCWTEAQRAALERLRATWARIPRWLGLNPPVLVGKRPPTNRPHTPHPRISPHLKDGKGDQMTGNQFTP